MDFFDIRKISPVYGKSSNAYQEDYSNVAFLPVVMICLVIVGVCVVYHWRRWSQDKRQLHQLGNFYDQLESIDCGHGAKSVTISRVKCEKATNGNGVHKNGKECEKKEPATCAQVSRVVSLPVDGGLSPFFQPTFKSRHLQFDRMQKLLSANDVIFYFAKLSAELRPDGTHLNGDDTTLNGHRPMRANRSCNGVAAENIVHMV